MGDFARKWWGKAFIEALEKITMSSRLMRGRSYARNGKIEKFNNKNNIITASVRGSINPYFGVYTTPYYEVEITLKPIEDSVWKKIIDCIGGQVYHLSHLILHQMPDDIEEVFEPFGVCLLPQSSRDFVTTKCSCPDYAVPCKHVAGVYYLIAAQLDENPFLLFELRGLPSSRLQKLLAETPLGKVLARKLDNKNPKLTGSNDAILSVKPNNQDPSDVTTSQFWYGTDGLPPVPSRSDRFISAALIKRGGDFPSFWESHSSFIEWMEQIYTRVGKGLFKVK